MGDFPSGIGGGGQCEAFGAGGLTCSGSSNTKGSYTQLTSGISRDAHGIWLNPSTNGGIVVINYLMDLAIGAGGSEQVIVPNIPQRHGNIAATGGPIFVPIFIPAGTRMAARGQSSNGASAAFDFDAAYYTGGEDQPSGLGDCIDYGMVTGTTRLTAVVSGTANNKGSYTQIVASTTREINWLLLFVTETSSGSNTQYCVSDIAIGAGGSEQIIIASPVTMPGNSYQARPFCHGLPVTIPAGSRIAIRCQTGENSVSIYHGLIGVS